MRTGDLLSLLDDTPELVAPGLDTEALSQWAFLYTCTEKGTSTGVKFMATVPDAQAWCSSPLSRGQMHGTRWMYCWTSVLNYSRHHSGDADVYGQPTRLRVDLTGCTDDGTWDERITSTGCRMVKLDEIADVLGPLGIEVVGRPRVARPRRAAA